MKIIAESVKSGFESQKKYLTPLKIIIIIKKIIMSTTWDDSLLTQAM